MDSLGSYSFDIHDAFCRYRTIRLGKLCLQGKEGSKDLLAQYSQTVESSINANSRISIFDEIRKLMSRLNLMGDFSEFSCFYEFVYFICREHGQKNITVNKAVEAWRLILAGRFRLLNQWCEFVEKNQRHNISEDTWRQVLAFSRCVHENLKGYDPAGAWPVLIDEFVEHMYRVTGRNENTDAMDSQSCVCDDSLPGLKCLPGLKRKCPEDMETDDGLSSLITTFPNSTNLDSMTSFKRNKSKLLRSANGENNFTKCNNSSRPSPCSKSQCAIEGCLSQGFSGSFSARFCSQLKRARRAQLRKSYKPTGGEKILPRVI